MKANMGNVDQLIRGIVAIVFGALYFTNTVTGVTGTVLLVVALILIVTSFIRFCPIYSVLGINSCSIQKSRKS